MLMRVMFTDSIETQYRLVRISFTQKLGHPLTWP